MRFLAENNVVFQPEAKIFSKPKPLNKNTLFNESSDTTLITVQQTLPL